MTVNDVKPRVWATRPAAQNGAWQQTLQAQDFDTVDLPLLAITPVSDADAVQAVKDLILDFDQFQKVIFVSQNAVQETFEWLHSYWPQLPSGLTYFAVGLKTATCVEEHGVDVVSAGAAMNTDELLALPQLTQVWGEKIIICRGRGGLPRLGEVLHERGAIVRYCELYERGLPATVCADAEAFLAQLSERDIVPLFSGDALRNWVTVLEANRIESRDMALVVPGKRVVQLAHSFGFERVLHANNATESAMLDTILAHLPERF